MKTIELNEQQADLLREFLEYEILEDGFMSNTTRVVLTQIIKKLENETS